MFSDTYYRSGYYSVLFEDFEQKVISSYIVFLWERDPCKAKWALAAKAYSIIRDHVGKEHAPLDAFLMLIADFVGIVEPQQYLAVMGWEIAVDGIGTISLIKNETMEIDSFFLSTNISVEDIISFASYQGFAGVMNAMVAPPGHPAMTMAATAQPNSAKYLEKNDKDNRDQSKNTVAMTRPEVKKEMKTAVTHQLTPLLPSSQNTVTAVNSPPAATAQLNTLPLSSQNVVAAINAPPAVAFSTPIAPVTSVLEIENPFDIENIMDFDPAADLPIWDPSTGDAWDAFDMSAWVYED